MDLAEASDVVLERSFDVIKQKSPKLLHMEKKWYKMMLGRNNVKTFFKTIIVESNDITFNIIPYCNGKADMKKYGVSFMVASEFKCQGQKFYSLVVGNFDQISIYTSHFLERYVERHLDDDSPINIDTFIKYLKETDGITFGFVEIEKNKLQWATHIGNTCGCMLTEKVMLHKTFIDKSTILKGKKKDANDKGNELTQYVKMNHIGQKILPQGIKKYFNFQIK